VEDDTILLNGDGGVTLLLPALHVTEISVKVDGETVTDYACSYEAGVLRRAGCWPDGLANIEVTYSHGWDPVPGDVQDAVLEQAAILAMVPIGVQSESAGTQSITWGHQATTGVTDKWASAVALYRISGGDRS
jgi:hypothetical protein